MWVKRPSAPPLPTISQKRENVCWFLIAITKAPSQRSDTQTNKSIADTDKTSALMQQVKAVEGITLIDTPGHLSQQGLLPLFIYSDIIVCPYFYDAASLQSTVTFLKFVEVLKSKVPIMQTQVVLVPNRYDKRIGKKEELKLWDETDKAFTCYGEVLPRISNKADMMRYNTLSLLDSQSTIIQPTYNRLYEILQQRRKGESSQFT